MIFDCRVQISKDKAKYVEIVKPIIPLWNRFEELDLQREKLVKEKTEIEKDISEMKSVRGKVEKAAAYIDAEIDKLKNKLTEIEFQIEEKTKEGITLKDEIYQFKQYILSVREFYDNTSPKFIYAPSNGDLYVTERIILGYSPRVWSSSTIPKMPDGISLTFESVEKLLKELEEK